VGAAIVEKMLDLAVRMSYTTSIKAMDSSHGL
jgi:hypothetical protein